MQLGAWPQSEVFGGGSLNRNQIVIVKIWMICSFFVSLLQNH